MKCVSNNILLILERLFFSLLACLTRACFNIFASVVAYQLSLKMGDVLGDGTEGSVFIQLIGDKGLTEQIQLRQAGNSKIRFEKGRTYKFTVETVDIGKVRFQQWPFIRRVCGRVYKSCLDPKF